MNFIGSALNMKNAFERRLSAEKIANLNYELVVFSFLQFLIGIIIIKAVISSVRKAKGTVHNSGFKKWRGKGFI